MLWHLPLLACQAFGLLTVTQFVVAAKVYFKIDREWKSTIALILGAAVVIAFHAYCVLTVLHRSLWLESVAYGGLLLSNWLFWTAIRAHGAGRPNAALDVGDATPFVDRGPYRWVRHPFYLAYVVGYLSASVVGGWWLQYATAAILFAIYNAVAAGEEGRFLASAEYGPAYRDYVRRTWRWCPYVW